MEQEKNEMNAIKITLLEIKPPLNELEKINNEISIIFQGINVFYNLRKLITNKTEILINNCKNSVIISLVKSDNIFASALFNIKNGENWVTFNYESKKHTSIKTNMNNIDCLKIKIFCNQKKDIKTNLIDSNNKANLNLKNSNKDRKNSHIKKRYHKNKNNLEINNKLFNNDIKCHNRYNSIVTENNHSINANKLNTNTPINKCYSHRVKYSDMTLKTRNNINKSNLTKFQNSDYSSLNINQKRINTSSSNIKKNNTKNILARFNSYKVSNKNKTIIRTQADNIQTLNKYLEGNSGLTNNKTDKKRLHINNKIIKNNNFYFLNHSPIHNKFYENNHSISNREYNNNLFYGFNKYNSKSNILNSLNVNKNKQIIKSRLFKNNIQGNVTNSYSTATTKKNDIEGSLNSFQDYEERINKKGNNKYKNPLTNQRQKMKKEFSNIESKSQIHMLLDNNINMNKNNEQINNLNTFNNIENNLFDKKIDEQNNDIEENEFIILKNDFELLYNKQYINNIKNDLFELEIELFVEKTIELISAYHREMELKIYENKINKNTFKVNTKIYTSLYKLNNKLQLIKDIYEAKQINLYNNKKAIKHQKNNNLLLYKKEFNLFDKLINKKNNYLNNYNNLNINKNLKDIFNIIVNNDKNKNKILLYNGKYKEWLQTKIFNIYNTNKNNINIYNKKIRTKVIPKKQLTKISNNIYNMEASNNNKLYNNFINEGIYIKKAPKSPLYSAKTKSKEKNFNI